MIAIPPTNRRWLAAAAENKHARSPNNNYNSVDVYATVRSSLRRIAKANLCLYGNRLDGQGRILT